MVFRLSQLGTALALAFTLGCIGFGSDGGTGLDSGVATEGFDEGLDSGNEGGLLGGCEQYLYACQQDPYCVCFLECAVEVVETRVPLDHCLAQCNLASTPYWADQFLVCIQGEIDNEPNPDPLDDRGGE